MPWHVRKESLELQRLIISQEILMKGMIVAQYAHMGPIDTQLPFAEILN
jgi:hypothetical protein